MDLRVEYITPEGGMLLWNMEYTEFIDGYEMNVYNKELRNTVTGPIKVFYIPNNATQYLLSDLHWETRYRIVLVAIRGQQRTQKIEVSLKTSIFVEPVYSCDIFDIDNESANVHYKYKPMKNEPKIYIKFSIENSISNDRYATVSELKKKIVNLNYLQASTNYIIQVNIK